MSWPRSFIAVLWFAVVLLATSCGGGSSDDTVSIQLVNSQVSSSLVEDNPLSLEVSGSLKGLSAKPIYLQVAVDAKAMVFIQTSSVELLVTGVQANEFLVTLPVRSGVTPGTYVGQLSLQVCSATPCSEPLSAVTVPIKLEVLPNLKFPSKEVVLVRRGDEPVPTIRVPFTVPPQMPLGELTVAYLLTPFDRVEVKIEGRELVITGREVPVPDAPHMDRIELRGADARYHVRLDIRYNVIAPAGGQTSLALSPATGIDIRLHPIEPTRTVVTVSRATWCTAWPTVELLHNFTEDPSAKIPGLSFSRLDNSRYEFSVDPSRFRHFGSYSGTIYATGQDLCGATSMPVNLYPSAYLAVASIDIIAADRNGTPLGTTRVTRPVQVIPNDSSEPASTPPWVGHTWSARVNVPWIRLQRNTGTIGIDGLEMDIDTVMFVQMGAVGTGAAIAITSENPAIAGTTVNVAVQILQ
jgi:hypothetical protein